MDSDYLFVSTTHVDYEISLHKTITYILGDSGVGKTTLFDYLGDYVQANKKDLAPYLSVDMKLRRNKRIDRDLIEIYLNEVKKVQSSVVVYSQKLIRRITAEDLNYHKDNDGSYKSFLEENKGIILYCDEDLILESLFDIFLKSCIIFGENIRVLVAGRLICNCKYLDVDSLYTVVYDKKNNINKNVKLYNMNKSPEKVNLVLVEDSKSGYGFYKMYFSKLNIPVYSVNGKTNIINILACLDYTKHFPYIICDGYSFANMFLKLDVYLKYIKKCGYWSEDSELTSRLMCNTCLEHIISHSDWVRKGIHNLSDNERKKLACLIGKIESDLPEKISAKELMNILKFSCGGYSKKIDNKNCITKSCKSFEDECSECHCLQDDFCSCSFYDKYKLEKTLSEFKDFFPKCTNKNNLMIGNVTLKDNSVGLLLDNEFTIFNKTNNTTFIFENSNSAISKLPLLSFSELLENESLYNYKYTWKTYDRFNSRDSIQRKFLSSNNIDDNKAKHMEL